MPRRNVYTRVRFTKFETKTPVFIPGNREVDKRLTPTAVKTFDVRIEYFHPKAVTLGAYRIRH
jgi:hypothetical protein